MKQRIEIVKNKRTGKFRVRYIGNNNEVLAVSETMDTRHNCRKNISAMIKLWDCPGTKIVEI